MFARLRANKAKQAAPRPPPKIHSDKDSDEIEESEDHIPYWEQGPSKTSKDVIDYMYKNVYPDLTLSLKEVGLFIRSSDEF